MTKVEHTYVCMYLRTGQTLHSLHNFLVRGDKQDSHANCNLSILGSVSVFGVNVVTGTL